MYNFNKLTQDQIPWEVMSMCYDHTVFKSKQWADFLKEYYKIQPFVIAVSEKEQIIGYFYGQQIKRMGIKIVASPFEGWSTSYQGLTMLSPISINKRIDIYEELIPWLFKNKYCSFFQVTDWQLEVPECAHRDVNFELIKGYVLDLTLTEEELYKNMSYSSVKYCINKANKNGVKINIANDIKQYAKDFYTQLSEVFVKQGLKPTHTEEQTYCMLNHTLPNQMIALFATDREGNTIATAFYPYDGFFGFFSGAACFHSARNIYPNEPLMWEAIKELKNRGVKQMEFGGGRRYKEKYGPVPYVKPKLIAAKYPWILTAKNMAKSSYYSGRSLIAKLKGNKANIGLSKG